MKLPYTRTDHQFLLANRVHSDWGSSFHGFLGSGLVHMISFLLEVPGNQKRDPLHTSKKARQFKTLTHSRSLAIMKRWVEKCYILLGKGEELYRIALMWD